MLPVLQVHATTGPALTGPAPNPIAMDLDFSMHRLPKTLRQSALANSNPNDVALNIKPNNPPLDAVCQGKLQRKIFGAFWGGGEDSIVTMETSLAAARLRRHPRRRGRADCCSASSSGCQRIGGSPMANREWSVLGVERETRIHRPVGKSGSSTAERVGGAWPNSGRIGGRQHVRGRGRVTTLPRFFFRNFE